VRFAKMEANPHLCSMFLDLIVAGTKARHNHYACGCCKRDDSWDVYAWSSTVFRRPTATTLRFHSLNSLRTFGFVLPICFGRLLATFASYRLL
jgi:hypothetical protein